jgi:hypothetical protein
VEVREMKTETRSGLDLVAGDRVRHNGRWYTVGGFGKSEGRIQMILVDGGRYEVIAFTPERKRFEVEA